MPAPVACGPPAGRSSAPGCRRPPCPTAPGAPSGHSTIGRRIRHRRHPVLRRRAHGDDEARAGRAAPSIRAMSSRQPSTGNHRPSTSSPPSRRTADRQPPTATVNPSTVTVYPVFRMPAATPLTVTRNAWRRRSSPLGCAQAAEQLDLHQVDRDRRTGCGRRSIGAAPGCRRAARSRPATRQHAADGRRQPAPQVGAERVQVGGHEQALVVRGDARVGLGQHHLDQIERRAEERPLAVHRAQLVGSPPPRSRRRAPRRRPATTAAAGASASTRTPTGSRAASRRRRPSRRRAGRLPIVRSLELAAPASRRGSTAMKRGVVVDDARDRPSRDGVGERVHPRRATRRRARRRRRQRRVERGGRVDLERPQREPRQAELRLDHLALLGDAQPAVDRSGRLRLDGQIRRPAAAADAAAAAVEQRQLDAAARGTRATTILLRLVQLPVRGQAAAVLRRVRVADHHFLAAAAPLRGTTASPSRLAQRCRRRSRRSSIVSNSGTTRSGRSAPASFCSSSTASTSDGACRHRDDVGAERLRRQPRGCRGTSRAPRAPRREAVRSGGMSGRRPCELAQEERAAARPRSSPRSRRVPAARVMVVSASVCRDACWRRSRRTSVSAERGDAPQQIEQPPVAPCRPSPVSLERAVAQRERLRQVLGA